MASKEPRRRRRGLVILVLALLVAAGAVVFRMLRRRSAEEWPVRYGPSASDRTHRPVPSVVGSPPPAGPAPVTPPTPPTPDTSSTPTTPADPVVAAAPDPVAAADDLVVIDGIGPKIAAALTASGVSSFAALAATSPERLREVLAEHGLRFAPTLETWPTQARARLA